MSSTRKKRPKLAIFKNLLMALIFSVCFVFFAFSANAAIRDTLSYQAKITDANLLAPIDGNYNMEFRIYDALSGGNLLWTETWNAGNQVALEDGVFTVELNSLCASWTGACASNDGVDWSSDSLYLEMAFDADGNGSFEEVFTPRRAFTAVPYAQMAARLNTAEDIIFTNDADHSIYWNESSDKTLTVENNDATAVANLAVEGQLVVGSFAVAPTALNNGAMYYNTTNNKFYIRENGNWVNIGSSGDGGDAIWDLDRDTGVQVEDGPDDDTIHFDLGGVSPITDALVINQSNGFLWNDAGDALDFRAEGDTNTDLFFIDASADMIGIGEASPEFILDLISGMQIGTGSDADQDLLTVDNGDILTHRPSLNYEKDIFFSGLDGFVFNNPDGSTTMMANSEDSYAYMLANAQDNSFEVEFLASHNSDPNTYTNLYAHAFGLSPTTENPYLAFQQGANSRHYLDVISSGSDITDIIFNDDSYDANFRIEGDTDTNLFFLDASADNIGIGEAAPDASAKLEVAGNFMLDDYVYFNNTTTDYLRHDGTTFVMSDDLLASADDSYDFGSSTLRWNDNYLGGYLYLGADGDDYDIHFDEVNNNLVFNENSEANGLRIEGYNHENLLIVDAVNDRVGVGINTTSLFDARFVVENNIDDNALRLVGPDGTYHHGSRLHFGDGDYVYIDEYVDDSLGVYAAGDLYFDVGSGSIYMPDAYNTIVSGRDLQISATGQLGYKASSLRYKENVLDMEDISWLYDLRPVNFTYKDKTKEVYNKETGQMETVVVPVDHSKQYGLIAEETELVNPAIVSYDSDGLVETVNYSYLMTPLLKAVQDNKAAVDPILDRIKVANNGLEIERYDAADETDALVLTNDGEGAGLHLVQTGDSNGLGHGAAIYISGAKNSSAGDNDGISDSSDSYAIYINSEESNGEQKIIGMETDAGASNDTENFYVRADGVTKIYAGLTAPVRNEDGEFGFAVAGNKGRLYYQLNGEDYYINNSGTGDFSEYVLSSDQSLFEDWGTIISLEVGGTEAKAKRSSEMRDKNVLGVVSEFGTRNNDNDEGSRHEDPNYVNVALMGQVPAKVTVQNGFIEAGDYLTTSLVYGHAMKADVGDPVIGIALESFYGNVSSDEGMIDILLSRNTNGNISALLQELQEKKSLSKEEVLDVIMNENLVANYLVMTKGEVMDGLKIHGELELDRQNIGEVVLPAGETIIDVNFPYHFKKKPVVTVSPYIPEDNDIFFNFQYLLVNINIQSFRIKLNQPLSYDLHFNWQAFAVADYTDDFIVPETKTISAEQPVINSLNCSLDNLGGCLTAHDCWQYSEVATWTGEACILKENSF